MQALSERENRRLPFKALVRRRDGHSSGEAPLLSAYVPKRLRADGKLSFRPECSNRHLNPWPFPDTLRAPSKAGACVAKSEDAAPHKDHWRKAGDKSSTAESQEAVTWNRSFHAGSS